jgi:hypothetical protein
MIVPGTESRIKRRLKMYLTDKSMREAGPPVSYDNTMLVSIDNCKRKFYFFWRGLDYEVTPSYFTFGRAWQEGLSAWYGTKGAIGVRLNAALSVATNLWNDEGSPEVRNDTLENLKMLLLFYAVEYETENFEILTLDDQVELGFEVPAFKLEGTEISLSGAIDGYLSWKSYGKGVLENKSSGMYLTDQYLSQWSFSSQVSQYLWGLRQILGEEPFGCLMNCACKRLSQKAKNEFKLSGTIPEGIFARNLEKRSKFQMEEFEKGCRRIIKEIFVEWHSWDWPKCRDPIYCVGGIGKSPCLFKNLCLLDADPWDLEEEDLLGQGIKWREESWEPWKRGEK